MFLITFGKCDKNDKKAVRDPIHPDVTMSTSYHIDKKDDKNVVIIKFNRILWHRDSEKYKML